MDKVHAQRVFSRHCDGFVVLARMSKQVDGCLESGSADKRLRRGTAAEAIGDFFSMSHDRQRNLFDPSL